MGLWALGGGTGGASVLCVLGGIPYLSPSGQVSGKGDGAWPSSHRLPLKACHSHNLPSPSVLLPGQDPTWTHKSLPLNLCMEPVTEDPLLGPQPPRPSSHPDGASAPLPKSPLTSAWNALPPLPYKSRSTEWGECRGVDGSLPTQVPRPMPCKSVPG